MKKLLLIDDSAFSRKTVKRFLEQDYLVLEADGGKEGLRVFAEEKPDIIILDLTMPEMNGLEVLERLKAMDKSVRVIIGTADIQDYNRQKASELGALGFVNKPLQKETLLPLIEQALNI